MGGSDGGQANGPRSWERPWSLEEMRKESGNWSLAGDAGVGLWRGSLKKNFFRFPII